jgi:hypothetical protein
MSKATRKKAGRKAAAGVATAGLVGVTALLPVHQMITRYITQIIATGQRLIWPLVVITSVFLLIAAREFRKPRLVAHVQKLTPSGEVLDRVIAATGGSRFARADVIRALRVTYGRTRPVRGRPTVPGRESRPPNDIEWWRRVWRWVWDLDDSTIENLADDVLALAVTKKWVKEDGSTPADDVWFDDYYSTKRDGTPGPATATQPTGFSQQTQKGRKHRAAGRVSR